MPRQVEGTPPVDPREQELFDTMVMDVMEYIHGVGSEQIEKLLRDSTDTRQTMANIAYKAVRGVMDKNAKTATIEMDMDIVLGLTTEAIDMVEEFGVAANQVMDGTNITQLKEDVLLKVAVLHGEQLEAAGFTEEQKQIAATDMRDYMADKGINKAFDYVNSRAMAEGMNPNDMMRAGNEAALGARRPLADAMEAAAKHKVADSPLMSAAAGLPPEPSYGPSGPAVDYAARPQWQRDDDKVNVGEDTYYGVNPPRGFPEEGDGRVPVTPPVIPPPDEQPDALMGDPNRMPRGRR